MTSLSLVLRPVRRPGLCVGTLLAAAMLAACSPPPPAEEPVRAVKLLTVGVESLSSPLEYAGEVRARTEARLGFRVAGKIVQRPVILGQRVQAGTLLAQLDAGDYQLAADAARAQVSAATTQRDLAAADLKRFAALREQNFISGAELERREATLKAAQATLDQAKAQAAAQGNQSSYTRLLADAPGVVTALEAEPGQVVAAGAPVVRVALDGPRDVVFSVPEDRLPQMRAGQPVAVRGWASTELLKGQVREIAASADPATRTFAVKVAVEAAQAPALGATVTVIPQQPERQAMAVLKLPTTALRKEGEGTAVWVFDPATSTVRAQPVQVATADGNAAVIAAGLSPGQQVVATGVHVLSPGQKVTVYQPKYPADREKPAEPAPEKGATTARPSGAAGQ